MEKKTAAAAAVNHFIRRAIADDVAAGARGGRVQTRFPPEPNGYLHLGHAKAMVLNFQLAKDFGGMCLLRLDDTNPEAERAEFAEAIARDARWLGCDFGDAPRYASDYFEQIYACAETLVKNGEAYVDDADAEEVRAARGTPTQAGRESPHRSRPPRENLDLLRRMKGGEFAAGARILRAKIDMAHPNLTMRDPPLYRILNAAHARAGNCHIYPLYDFAHTLSDALEGVTHSLCTTEFENHRPLYDWFLQKLNFDAPPRQYEFSKLTLGHTALSKRHLAAMVRGGVVGGWDDPRLPTLAGLRRRGCPPAAIRAFCADLGISKAEGVVPLAHLEYFLRDELNRAAARAAAVLRPLKITLRGLPAEGRIARFANNPHDEAAGQRQLVLGEAAFIERDDFAETPPPGFRRLTPGGCARLLNTGGAIAVRDVVKDGRGEVVELQCDFVDAARAPKKSAALHWVPQAGAVDFEARLFAPLFVDETPRPPAAPVEEWGEILRADSLTTLSGCKGEAALADAEAGAPRQFLRQGYFCADSSSRPGRLVFNRTVTLREDPGKS